MNGRHICGMMGGLGGDKKSEDFLKVGELKI